VKVSILSFPENATPGEMAGRLGVIQLYLPSFTVSGDVEQGHEKNSR
jgi:hypothetical protein